MNKRISFLIITTMIFGLIAPVYADDAVKIKVDGKELTDAQAILQDGTTLLPVRSVSKALGGEVLWDDATKTVTVIKNEKIVTAPIGEKIIFVNGSTVNVSIPPQVINGRTYIPLRAMGEALDCRINWVKEAKTVEINNTSADTTSSTGKYDIFGEEIVEDTKVEDQISLPEEIYMIYGEIVLLPAEGNWINWSDGRVVQCDWSIYNEQNVIMIKGLKKGSCTLKIYESNDSRGRIEGDYREIEIHVVDESSKNYVQQKAERVASGFDIVANQMDLIKREDDIIKKYNLQLENFSRRMYTTENHVLIIPIKSSKELKGTICLYAREGQIEAVLDEYAGKPAIFIKQIGYSTDGILRYFNDGSDGLNLEIIEDTYDPDLLWEREMIRTSPELNNMETAAWAFELWYTEKNDKRLIEQEKRSREKGISYDLYLKGEA